MKIVRFIRKKPPYNSGEIAGFEGVVLEKLLASGDVELHRQAAARMKQEEKPRKQKRAI